MSNLIRKLNRRPRLAAVLQITALIAVFQGVIATTPTVQSAANTFGESVIASPHARG